MASRFSLSEPIDRVAEQIEDAFEYIIQILITRKSTLLAQLTAYRNELESIEANKIQTEKELQSLKHEIEVVRSNELKNMQETFLSEIENKFNTITENASPYNVLFKIDTRTFVEEINKLGNVVKIPVIPRYSEINLPVLALGRQGKAKGNFNDPRGIAFEEETQSVYVCDMNNSSIKVVPLGEPTECNMKSYGSIELNKPWGILIAKNSIYITDWYQSAILKFQRSNFQFVKKVGKKGEKKGDFNFPRQLDKGPNGNLYVAEDHNNRISVLDVDLNFKQFIEHKSIKSPMDVKFSKNFIFVLTCNSTERVHMLDLNGAYMKPIVSLDPGIRTWFFCLDLANNIVISDWSNHSIRVYDDNDKLLHTIGRTGHDRGEMHWPYGITTTRNGKLIVASGNKNYGLQTF